MKIEIKDAELNKRLKNISIQESNASDVAQQIQKATGIAVVPVVNEQTGTVQIKRYLQG